MIDFHSQITRWSISELSEKYSRLEVSPVEAVSILLDNIEHSQTILNSFITVCRSHALKQARQSEKRYLEKSPLGILDGIPYAAKDLIYTKGIPTTMGCSYYKDFRPSYNAHVITLLDNQGSVLLGKANTQQFAMGATGDRSFTGSVHNPCDPSKISGGSSSGSAAAVASGLCSFALATDTGGSARVPAALCGVTGIKPTYGRISTRGIFPASTTFDTVGIISESVRDSAIVLNAIAAFDSANPLSCSYPQEDFTRSLESSLSGSIIHIPEEQVRGKADSDIEKNFWKSIRLLKEHGAVIRHMSFPDYSLYRQVRTQILFAEAYCTHEQLYNKHPSVYDEDVRSDLENGKKITAPAYIRLLEKNREFSLIFRDLFKDVEIMAVPSTSIAATDIDYRGNVTVNGTCTGLYEALSRFNWFSSMSGYPAITVPNGFSGNLPTGIQFIARPFQENRLYQIAYQLEKLQEMC